MQNLFVSHKIAKLAEIKGMDEPCFGYYIKEKYTFQKYNLMIQKYHLWNMNSHIRHASVSIDEVVMAPMFQQITDWFLKTHNLNVAAYWERSENAWKPCIHDIPYTTEYITESNTIDNYLFESKNEALEKSIEIAFELI